MKKNVVRINETQLRKLIKESVRKVMKEALGPDDFGLSSKGGLKKGLGPNDPIVAKAQQLYDEGVDWEEEVNDVDGGWGDGFVYAEVVDENGETWQFEADAGFNWEGDWVLQDDTIEEVRFTAPDGTTGTLPRP